MMPPRNPNGCPCRSLKRATLTLMFLLSWPILWGADGKRVFSERCASCHGSDARGTGKAPGVAQSPRLSGQSVEQLADVIKHGFPDSGMPAFDLPGSELNAVANYVHALNGGVIPEGAPGTKYVTWGQPQTGDRAPRCSVRLGAF